MSLRDALGNDLHEGDAVSLAVGTELGVGIIKKIDSGLGIVQTQEGAQGAQPYVLVEIVVSRPVVGGGIAIGIIKAPRPAAPTIVEG